MTGIQEKVYVEKRTDVQSIVDSRLKRASEYNAASNSITEDDAYRLKVCRCDEDQEGNKISG